jgi:HlyD family secretion protein
MVLMKRRTKVIGILGLALLLGGAVAGFVHARKDSPDALGWDPVARGDVRETISASGSIKALTSSSIGTNFTAVIKELRVKEGQDVKAGQLLVVLDRERLRQQLGQALAGLDAARKDADRLEAAFARTQERAGRTERLFQQGLVSDEDYRQSRLDLESARLNLEAARAGVARNGASAAAARDDLGKTEIRSPIAGRVTSLVAQQGEMAIPGTSNLPGATLMVISDMSRVIAEIKANESEVVKLREGQPAQVTVEALPGRVFPAKVHEIGAASVGSSSDANMYKVKVAIDMAARDVDQLRPGMSARAVILVSEARGVLRVPLQAVLDREDTLEEANRKGLLSPSTRSVVMVAKGASAEERTVALGIANTQFYEVKQGLAEGDQVLTGPVRKVKELRNGDRIKLRKISDTELEASMKGKGAP